MSASNEKINLQKSLFSAINKVPIVEKRFDRHRWVLFNVHMYDEFHVPGVLILLLYL